MTPIDADLVRRKLAVITRNLGDLAVVADLSVKDYMADRFRQKGTERLLQEAIDAAVDANLHLLRTSDAPTPSDYYESFVELGREDIIPHSLAERLAPSAGLRNRLVHEYDDVDDATVLDAVGEARSEFAQYVEAVERFLSKQGM